MKYQLGSAGTRVQSLGREDPLGKGMATHSSILALEIPRTEEPGGLQSTGSQESDTTEPLSTHAPALPLQRRVPGSCWTWGWSLGLCSASLLEAALLGRGVPSVSHVGSELGPSDQCPPPSCFSAPTPPLASEISPCGQRGCSARAKQGAC